MAGKLVWHDDVPKRLVETALGRLLTRCCIFIKREAQRSLSIPGTGKSKGKKTGRVTHAPVGQPPFKQTGRGRASVTYEVDEASGKARVGTNVLYMKFQELGTRFMGARPWLTPAYLKLKAQIRTMCSGLVK